MAAGQPTKYDPAYCAVIIELGRQGKSVTQMACQLDVVKQTMFNWAADHPEFLDAMTKAKQLSQAWWEDVGQNNIVSMPGAVLNASVYSRSMAARFPDDWRENKGVELTGANGGPVEFKKIERAIIDPQD